MKISIYKQNEKWKVVVTGDAMWKVSTFSTWKVAMEYVDFMFLGDES